MILIVMNTFLYMTSNHFQIFEPQLLRMTWLDQWVPFTPYTVWIYLTEYILFFAVYWTCKDERNLNRYAYAFLAQQAFSVVIFWIWPTVYPRELFPLPSSLDPLTYFAFEYLRLTDSPTNCCPSLHVSSVYLSSFMFLHEQPKKFPYFFVWATAITLSTLTTKQHYAVDVGAGILVALVFFWLFSKQVHYQANR